MRKNTITFRLAADEAKELDAVAASLDRDRSWVLTEAVRAYLELHRWQVRHIQEGIRQADAGIFATQAEVDAAFSLMKGRKR